jgi:hypothetical protein
LRTTRRGFGNSEEKGRKCTVTNLNLKPDAMAAGKKRSRKKTSPSATSSIMRTDAGVAIRLF